MKRHCEDGGIGTRCQPGLLVLTVVRFAWQGAWLVQGATHARSDYVCKLHLRCKRYLTVTAVGGTDWAYRRDGFPMLSVEICQILMAHIPGLIVQLGQRTYLDEQYLEVGYL